MRVSLPWSKGGSTEIGNSGLLPSCDPCGVFGDSDIKKTNEIDETDNTTLTTNSSRESQPDNNNIALENDATIKSSASEANETVGIEATEASVFENIRYLVEDGALCILDGVCCRRTCDDNDENSILPETCGGARRALRKRRSERVFKQSQICCTTISWGPDDEEDISVLQDPIIEEGGYDGRLNRGTSTPEHSVMSNQDMVTPKHRNSFHSKHEKCCAYCGVTKEEANNRMKICSRCRGAYYCSKECQSEDWYNNHKMTCVAV